MLSVLILLSVAAMAQTVPPATDCAVPESPLTAVNRKLPVYPDSAKVWNVGFLTLVVAVAVDSDGAVAGVKIYGSSGYRVFDEAALVSAEGTTYSPKVENCRAVKSVGLFTVDFDSK